MPEQYDRLIEETRLFIPGDRTVLCESSTAALLGEAASFIPGDRSAMPQSRQAI